MNIRSFEIGTGGMPIGVAHLEGDERGADGNLNPLEGIHYHQPEAAIERIPVPDRLEQRSREVRAVRLVEDHVEALVTKWREIHG